VVTLDTAIGVIAEAILHADAGDTYVPEPPSANMSDLAEVMIGDRSIDIEFIGVRPGEKIHEIMISEEELPRTIKRGDYYVICPILPKMRKAKIEHPALTKELSSADHAMSKGQLRDFLHEGGHLAF